MKNTYKYFGVVFIMVITLSACPNPEAGTFSAVPSTQNTPSSVTISVISGVHAPINGTTPVINIVETAQFTGTVAWIPDHVFFTPSTVYTATITLAAKSGYTLQGVPANFFTVPNAVTTNNINSGVITAKFPVNTSVVYNIAIADGIQNGMINPNQINALSGTLIKLDIEAYSGFRLKSLIVDGKKIDLGYIFESTYTFIMPAWNIIISADFEKLPDTIIGVNFQGGPVEEKIDITLGHENNLSISFNTPLTATVIGNFDYFHWYIDGEMIDNGHNNQLTIYGGNFQAGSYELAIICWNSGIPYSKQLTFRVIS